MYIPNLIGKFNFGYIFKGYGRFMLLVVSTWFAFSDNMWIFFTIFYATSYLFDIIDGKAARAFD